MTLDLDRVLSNFPEVEDFYPYIDIINKFALVRERKVDWENLFGGRGTKERVPIKLKKQLLSNDDFTHYILLPELATELSLSMQYFCVSSFSFSFSLKFIKFYFSKFNSLSSGLSPKSFILFDCFFCD